MRASKPLATLALLGWFSVGIISGMPGLANAQSPAEDRALAEALFQDGKALMSAGNPQEACPKLAESQRLDPGGGTQLLLGLCLEEAGRLASAWVELNEALSMAQRDGNEMRQNIARAHIDALLPRLSRLELVFGDAARREGLVIKQDGAEIPRAAWSTQLPLDPGKHVLVFEAPGCDSVQLEVEIDQEGKTVTVDVPSLVINVAAEGLNTGTPEVRDGHDAQAVEPHSTVHQSPDNSRKVVGYVVGGVGVAGIAAGAVFGIRAISLNNQVEDACPDPTCTRLDLRNAYSQSRSSATFSTVFFGVGLVGLATGVYLLLTDSSETHVGAESDSNRVLLAAKVDRWDLVATERGASFSLGGTF